MLDIYCDNSKHYSERPPNDRLCACTCLLCTRRERIGKGYKRRSVHTSLEVQLRAEIRLETHKDWRLGDVCDLQPVKGNEAIPRIISIHMLCYITAHTTSFQRADLLSSIAKGDITSPSNINLHTPSQHSHIVQDHLVQHNLIVLQVCEEQRMLLGWRFARHLAQRARFSAKENRIQSRLGSAIVMVPLMVSVMMPTVIILSPRSTRGVRATAVLIWLRHGSARKLLATRVPCHGEG